MIQRTPTSFLTRVVVTGGNAVVTGGGTLVVTNTRVTATETVHLGRRAPLWRIPFPPRVPLSYEVPTPTPLGFLFLRDFAPGDR